MLKLKNIFLLDENEIVLLRKLIKNIDGYHFLNDTVININYLYHVRREFKKIVNEFNFLNEYNLTYEEIKILETIIQKLNK